MTLIIMLRHIEVSIRDQIDAIIINYLALLQMWCSISQYGHIKRQKLTFDLSLLKNVRGRNQFWWATNNRVGTHWFCSPALPPLLEN